MEIVILDTDFFFELIYGNKEALKILNQDNFIFVLSMVSHAEIIKSATNTDILKSLNAKIIKLELETISISEKTSTIELNLIQKFLLSNSIQIADSLIAASALTYNCLLATCNKKHYKYIPGLQLLEHDVVPKKGGFFGFLE